MSTKSKSTKKPRTSTSHLDLPSDGWPEIIVLIPSRIIQSYCKLRKIDKIGKFDAFVMTLMILFAFVLLLFIITYHTNFLLLL
jgi:hypothetical protein